MEHYMELFIEKAKETAFYIPDIKARVETPEAETKLREWLKTERGSQEAARYCLTNGLIPFTPENIAFTGSMSFSLGADRIPKELHQRLIDIGKATDRKDWTMDDDIEQEEEKLVSIGLDSVYIENGRLDSVKLEFIRVVRVAQTYWTKHDLDEGLFE